MRSTKFANTFSRHFTNALVTISIHLLPARLREIELSVNNANTPSPVSIPENGPGKKYYRIALIAVAIAGVLLVLAGGASGIYSMGRYAGMATTVRQNDELRTAFAKTAADLATARDQIKALNDDISNKDDIIGQLQSQADKSQQAKCHYLQDQIIQGKQEVDQIFKNPDSSVSYGVFTLSPDQKKKVDIINERTNNFIRSMSNCT